MQLTRDWIDKADHWLWVTHVSEVHWSQRWVLVTARVLYAVVRDLTQGYTNLHAMSLVYTTLLSIVPFLALSFSVLKAFGVHDRLKPVLQNWLLAPLGPRASEVTEQLLSFVDNIRVGVLGAVGLGFLVFTVISLVQKVERAFNEAWRVNQTRPLSQRFSNYLSVILIGPLLAFSALGATATLVGSDSVNYLLTLQPFGWLYSLLARFTPYFFIILLFTFLYLFIPNTRVKFKNALIGGIVAGTVWQSIGYLFAAFVATSTRFTAIYSGFAVGIVLLFWIYIAWLILLTGATVAYYSQHSRQIGRYRINRPSAQSDEQVGLLLMYWVARQFDQGRKGLDANLLTNRINAEPDVLARLINKLKERNLVEMNADYELVPAQSLDRVTLREVLTTIRASEVPPTEFQRDLAPISRVLNQIDQCMQGSFAQLTLQDWVRHPSEGTPMELPEDDTEPQ